MTSAPDADITRRVGIGPQSSAFLRSGRGDTPHRVRLGTGTAGQGHHFNQRRKA